MSVAPSTRSSPAGLAGDLAQLASAGEVVDERRPGGEDGTGVLPEVLARPGRVELRNVDVLGFGILRVEAELELAGREVLEAYGLGLDDDLSVLLAHRLHATGKAERIVTGAFAGSADDDAPDLPALRVRTRGSRQLEGRRRRGDGVLLRLRDWIRSGVRLEPVVVGLELRLPREVHGIVCAGVVRRRYRCGGRDVVWPGALVVVGRARDDGAKGDEERG